MFDLFRDIETDDDIGPIGPEWHLTGLPLALAISLLFWACVLVVVLSLLPG